MSDAFPPERCPLCQRPNACALEEARRTGQAQGPCWCTQAAFSPALLAQLPPEARGKACICAACARPTPAPLSGQGLEQ
ncbi:cysteine-rich CWC family protein [Ramlibacter rhizophilus]|uniref:Cysteine-rich CWC family protein n=1 Tax=Ramlibacter rhizophilus TaxID=1781167 RepID=A0A4Z0BH78_9BURK|nr:cysteine-rich CWC family protein [Ramlibacter rhizophilus]TFY98101.1 hypothetical protein EZ242_16780 [Ramlibacter rhizophilus]